MPHVPTAQRHRREFTRDSQDGQSACQLPRSRHAATADRDLRRSTRSTSGANKLPLDVRVSTIETGGYLGAGLRVRRTRRRYCVGRERTASLTAWTMMSKSYGLPITS